MKAQQSNEHIDKHTTVRWKAHWPPVRGEDDYFNPHCLVTSVTHVKPFLRCSLCALNITDCLGMRVNLGNFIAIILMVIVMNIGSGMVSNILLSVCMLIYTTISVYINRKTDVMVKMASDLQQSLKKIQSINHELEYARDNAEQLVKERTKELVIARDEALIATRSKSEFLSNMSHEIRTPMNAILGYTEILQRDRDLGDEQRQSVNHIHQSCNHLLRLINDVLDFSKIEAGRMELNRSDFDLITLSADLSTMFAPRCAKKGLTLHIRQSADTHTLPVHGDENKLRQVLINLIDNAVKFTDHGEITFSLSKQPDNHYLFTVSDTGKGIPEHAHAQIFEVFHQDEQGIEKGGTGLGLAISYQQILLMGGKIEIATQSHGATFYFTLLLDPAKEEIQPTHTAKKIRCLTPGSEVKALVVDDKVLNRELLSQVLSSIGAEVIQAGDGKEALLQVREHLPDIVFMDFRMPVMNGLEAIGRIKSEFGDLIKTVMVTAHGFHHQGQLIKSSGCCSLITKPYRVEEIFNTLSTLLDIDYEYEQGDVNTNTQTTLSEQTETIDIDASNIPDRLRINIIKAAEYYSISELEALLSELQSIGPSAKKVSEHLTLLMNDYNMERIKKLLCKHHQ